MNNINALLEEVDFIQPFPFSHNKVILSIMTIKMIHTGPTIQHIITITSTKRVPTL